MPRTNVDKIGNQYRDFNDFVRGELKRQRKTQGQLAEYLNLHRSSITLRLGGDVEWTLREYFKTLEFLGLDFEIYRKEKNYVKEENRRTARSVRALLVR